MRTVRCSLYSFLGLYSDFPEAVVSNDATSARTTLPPESSLDKSMQPSCPQQLESRPAQAVHPRGITEDRSRSMACRRGLIWDRHREEIDVAISKTDPKRGTARGSTHMDPLGCDFPESEYFSRRVLRHALLVIRTCVRSVSLWTPEHFKNTLGDAFLLPCRRTRCRKETTDLTTIVQPMSAHPPET